MAFPLPPPTAYERAAEAAAEREREFDHLHPERETLWLATAAATEVLGARHSATRAFAQAASTMAKVDLWLPAAGAPDPAARPAPGHRGCGGRVATPITEPTAQRGPPVRISRVAARVGAQNGQGAPAGFILTSR